MVSNKLNNYEFIFTSKCIQKRDYSRFFFFKQQTAMCESKLPMQLG